MNFQLKILFLTNLFWPWIGLDLQKQFQRSTSTTNIQKHSLYDIASSNQKWQCKNSFQFYDNNMYLDAIGIVEAEYGQ